MSNFTTQLHQSVEKLKARFFEDLEALLLRPDQMWVHDNGEISVLVRHWCLQDYHPWVLEFAKNHQFKMDYPPGDSQKPRIIFTFYQDLDSAMKM